MRNLLLMSLLFGGCTTTFLAKSGSVETVTIRTETPRYEFEVETLLVAGDDAKDLGAILENDFSLNVNATRFLNDSESADKPATLRIVFQQDEGGTHEETVEVWPEDGPVTAAMANWFDADCISNQRECEVMGEVHIEMVDTGRYQLEVQPRLILRTEKGSRPVGTRISLDWKLKEE